MDQSMEPGSGHPRRHATAITLAVAAAVVVLLIITAVPLFEPPVDRRFGRFEEAGLPQVTPERAAQIERLSERLEREDRRWRAGVTGISHLSPEEFQRLLGAHPPPEEVQQFQALAATAPMAASVDDLPSRWDWRERGGVTGARHQGQCGACWAFSAAGAVEGLLRIYDDRELDLSEQQAIDCNTHDYGCSGGWMTGAYALWRDGGAFTETSIPYAGGDGHPCATAGLQPVARVAGWSGILSTREALKRALVVGPVAAGMYVPSALQHYTEGVFEHEGSRDVNHAVLLVGWDDELGAWIIKNSWGSGWGDRGYAYVAYGSCRLGSYAHRVRVPSDTPLRIHHETRGQAIIDDGPIVIEATVASMLAPLDPASVTLRIDLGDGFEDVAMVRRGGDTYEGAFRITLPSSLAAGTWVRYTIRASDVAGNQITLPDGGTLHPLEFQVLRRVYEASLESDAGWIAGHPEDTAVSGGWAWGVPEATYNPYQLLVQTGADHTPDGTFCFATGPEAGGDVESNDVDGGTTTLISPAIDLSALQDATLGFWLWFSNQAGANPWRNPLRIDGSSDGGDTWSHLYETVEGASSWRRIEVPIEGVLPLSTQMRFRFAVSEQYAASLLEAAIDDVEILTATADTSEGSGGETPWPDEDIDGPQLYTGPNPSGGETHLILVLPEPSPVRADLVDISGRLVRRLWHGELPAGSNRLDWDGRGQDGTRLPAGRYWARIETGGQILRRSLTILR